MERELETGNQLPWNLKVNWNSWWDFSCWDEQTIFTKHLFYGVSLLLPPSLPPSEWLFLQATVHWCTPPTWNTFVLLLLLSMKPDWQLFFSYFISPVFHALFHMLTSMWWTSCEPFSNYFSTFYIQKRWSHLLKLLFLSVSILY